MTATSIDPRSPQQVGNGEVCMTVDITGLQTFPEQYPVADPAGGPPGTLLGTMSQWGWHSGPAPEGADLDRTRRPYRTRTGEVRYVDAAPLPGGDDAALPEGSRWLRANPHRLDLVRVGLVLADPDGPAGYRAPRLDELGEARQTLDLWTGTIESDVVLAGTRLTVTTACHPDRDAFAVRVGPADGPDDDGALGVAVRLAFPYGSQSWSNAADWSRPQDHASELTDGPDGVVITRSFDGAEPTYAVRLRPGVGHEVRQVAPHEVLVTGAHGRLDLAIELLPVTAAGDPVDHGEPGGAVPEAAEVVAAAHAHWPAFWSSGAALDLAGSTDPRANELERRVVLSQYLTAIQCAGSLPPQETGLTVNSWRGRFHLEMHWWHGAHFALWGRPELLERSMGVYRRILPVARETARIQGYDGARWPKQIGPAGRESPSDIGPFLLWQQPHPIALAELLRRARPNGDAAERYGAVVDATARFMADVAERTDEGFALGPPLVPAQESYAAIRDRVTNPPFELAAWAWALGVAQEWRVRAGAEREPHWDEVRTGMVRPLVRDGRYAAIGVEPFTVRTDHPSMLYGLGVVPDTGLLDRALLSATLDDVLADWDWSSTWGWDFPALAMTATRLGRPDTAVDVLLMDVAKNSYLPNGHNRQTDSLPVYLPGNGGLLAAVALMVAGWDVADPADPADPAEVDLPGFPADGWVVRHEGFARSP